MSLFDIRNKLYKKEIEKDLTKHDATAFDPHVADLPKVNPVKPGDLWAEHEETVGVKEKLVIRKGIWIMGGVLLVVILLVTAYFIRQQAFSKNHVIITIKGPDKADSGHLITYEIDYSNNNGAELDNANLEISYPQGIQPEDNPNFQTEGPMSGHFSLGNVAGHGQGHVIFNIRAYTPQGALLYLKTQMVYNPAGVKNQYVSESQLGINVSASPISLEIIAPPDVASGDQVNYLVSYKNEGQDTFPNIVIRADYPDTFNFSTSDPKTSEGNNVWYVGDLAAGQSGKITITGKLSGNQNELKSIKLSVGTEENGSFISYNQQSGSTTIAVSPIAIVQTVNDSTSFNASPGDLLRFNIAYQNTGNIGLKNVVVTEKLDSPVLDYSTLDTAGGYFDEDTKTITWKASDHPQLASLESGRGGNIVFDIRVKGVIPVASANDKNFVISSEVTADSPDIPTPIGANKIVAGNVIDIKLNSKLILAVAGYYSDANIPNSGPVPPKVGQETTFTLHWQIGNVCNDVSNAQVSAVLPTGVTMTGNVYPTDSQITYNERDNSVVWEIGNVPAGAGVLSAPKEVSFQVKIKPSPSQTNKTPDLLEASTFSATDSFTGQQISAQAEPKTTALMEDKSLSSFQVVP